ncbi:MAG: BON domain-containing protein [Zoogloeaceae bacterium]|jgi:osmotically-inducible protein OsmY|nr:BON domain-containing protein [Zoogloeaceae bacterium]
MKRIVRPVLVCLALLLALPALQGCFGVALVGVTTGVMAVVDRRSIGVQTDDTAIELKAAARLSSALKEVSHVNFTSYNRRVLITGEAPSETVKAQIAEEVRRIENVQGVLNEVVISGNSGLASRSNDAFISSKVKARFVDADQFTASHVKVVTEAGAVFLLGIVNAREAAAAVQIARTTRGVLKVVNVLVIESDEEIRRIENSLANSATSTGGDAGGQ